MKVGIDFDNTIVSYERVFHKVALEKSLINSNVAISKISVIDHIRTFINNDTWTELQGYVYGKRILDADIYDGFIDFLKFAKNNQIEVIIVSHKTIYPYLGKKYNLHDSARKFISKFFINENINLLETKNIFFELTQREKAMRIQEESCDYFVDDLPEIFSLKEFPRKTKQILFDPEFKHKKFDHGFISSNWNNIIHFINDDFIQR